jgi:hypothetical protein
LLPPTLTAVFKAIPADREISSCQGDLLGRKAAVRKAVIRGFAKRPGFCTAGRVVYFGLKHRNTKAVIRGFAKRTGLRTAGTVVHFELKHRKTKAVIRGFAKRPGHRTAGTVVHFELKHRKTKAVVRGFAKRPGFCTAGTVLYFELKHWKTKEKKWSTLGWTYMHKEGFIKLVDGEAMVRTEAQGMHMYEKPLDFRSHFRQASMRKIKPLGEVPDLFLRFSEAA